MSCLFCTVQGVARSSLCAVGQDTVKLPNLDLQFRNNLGLKSSLRRSSFMNSGGKQVPPAPAVLRDKYFVG